MIDKESKNHRDIFEKEDIPSKIHDSQKFFAEKSRLGSYIRMLLLSTALASGIQPLQACKCDDRTSPQRTEKVDTIKPAEHIRISDKKYGIVHLWHPEYKKSLDEVIVFIHGFEVGGHKKSADISWEKYKLEEQFKESGKSALFIVPDSPKNNREGSYEMRRWEASYNNRKSIIELIEIAKKKMGITDMDEHVPITIIAHSGGGYTAAAWSEVKDVKRIILLDALYKYQGNFHRFVRGGGDLTLVATERNNSSISTHRRFMRRYKKGGQVKYIKSYLSHSKLPGTFIRKELLIGSDTSHKKRLRSKRGRK